jgi:hypothetical protein
MIVNRHGTPTPNPYRLGIEARFQCVSEPDAPGSTGCDLLAGDDAVVDEAMDCRGRNTELSGGGLRRSKPTASRLQPNSRHWAWRGGLD